MKRFISILVMLAMLASITAVSTSADGTLYFRSDFTSDEITNTQFLLGEFYIEPVDGILCGYSQAMALQARYDADDLENNPYGYLTYDTSVEMAFAEDELADGERCATVVYCNTNPINYGLRESTYYMNFTYRIETGELYLTGDGLGYNENDILAGPVARELVSDGSQYYTFGMSVTQGRVRCFLDGELIFDYVDPVGDKYIAAENPAQVVVWNDNNFMTIKDIQVASAGYLYPMADEPVTSETTTAGGDNNVTTTTAATNTKETTTAVSNVQVTDKDGNDVTDESGNKVTSQVIITDPAPAATNTGKPTGGSSTATGDATFVVVAAMVATLGCALIIRKVNA